MDNNLQGKSFDAASASSEDEHESAATAGLDDAVVSSLLRWGGLGGVAGCAIGAVYFGGVGGAFVGGTALSAVAIALSAALLAARSRMV